MFGNSFSKFRKMEDFLREEKEARAENVKGMLTFGVPLLDHSLLGVFKNDLVLIGAKSGGGKSELATNIALHNIAQGKKILFFSLESEPDEIHRRILYRKIVALFFADPERQSISNLSYLEWYAGKIPQLDKYYDEACDQMAKMPQLDVLYKGHADFTIDDLTKAIASKKDANAIIIDHFHYFDHEAGREEENHKKLIKEIKNLVFAYSIPIILIAHLRKLSKTHDSPLPEMEDFHGTSDLFKVPTKIILIASSGEYVPSPEFKMKFPSRWAGPTKWVTYMQVAKLRQDGSRTKYKAMCIFDPADNSYMDYYKLGGFDKNNEFVPITADKAPYWAKGNQ